MSSVVPTAGDGFVKVETDPATPPAWRIPSYSAIWPQSSGNGVGGCPEELAECVITRPDLDASLAERQERLDALELSCNLTIHDLTGVSPDRNLVQHPGRAAR